MTFSRAQHCVFWEVRYVPWGLSVVSWTPKGIWSVLVRPYVVALVYVETLWPWFPLCVSMRQEIPRVLYPEGDNSQAVAQEFAQMCSGAISWPGPLVLRCLPEVSPLVLGLVSHLLSGTSWLKDGKSNIPLSSLTYGCRHHPYIHRVYRLPLLSVDPKGLPR